MATDGKAKGNGAEPRLDDSWRVNEESRRRQLREDGRRPLAVNLAEGLEVDIGGRFLDANAISDFSADGGSDAGS